MDDDEWEAKCDQIRRRYARVCVCVEALAAAAERESRRRWFVLAGWLAGESVQTVA